MGWRVPPVVTATFVLLLCVSTLGLDPVTVTPNGGDFNFSVTINLSHTENVTDILYFIDDTPGVSKNLTSDNYTNYTSTFNLTNTGNYTLYTFVALNSTSNATSNVSFNIFDVSPMPNFYPPGNTSFVSSVTVTLQPATGSSKIYYTTEGFINTPAIGNISAIPAVYHEYTAPITLTAPLGGELRAPLFAYTVGDLASFQLDGSIRREFYDLLDRLPTPTFSPMGAKELGKITTPFPGPKASAQNSVEVQIDLPGMHNVSDNSYTTIVYTTDGRDPTRFSSVYSPWLDRANGTRRKINLVYAWFDSSNKTLNVNGTIQTLAEPVGWTYPYGQNTRTIKLKAMAFSQSEPNILSSGIQTAEYYFTRSPCSKTRCYAWDLKLTAGVCATLGHIDGIMCTSCEDAAQYWIKELLEVPVGEPTRLVDQFCRVGGGVVKLDFVEKEYCDHVKIAKGRCYGATCSAGWEVPECCDDCEARFKNWCLGGDAVWGCGLLNCSKSSANHPCISATWQLRPTHWALVSWALLAILSTVLLE